MIPAAMLGTDTLSAVMSRDPTALSHARLYLAERGKFSFSIITRYEVLRGLKAKQAAVQEAAFETFCTANAVLPLTEEIISLAADIYADLRRRGTTIGDADILIAATAMDSNLVLITNNTKHFASVPELQCENWLAP